MSERKEAFLKELNELCQRHGAELEVTYGPSRGYDPGSPVLLLHLESDHENGVDYEEHDVSCDMYFGS